MTDTAGSDRTNVIQIALDARGANREKAPVLLEMLQ